MRMLNIYKSDKYRSMIYRISKKPRNDRKIKTVVSFFVKYRYTLMFYFIFFSFSRKWRGVIDIPRFVRLYEEIIHKL